MNYVNGQLQKTLLSAPPAETGRKHGIKHRIKEKKIDEFKDWAAQLTDLVKRYMAPTPGTMMDFYSSATFSPVPSGNVRATDTGFIQPGDTATYWIDPATKQPVNYAFVTSLQGDPVNCTRPVRPGAGWSPVRLDDQDLRAGEGSGGDDHQLQLSVESVGHSRWWPQLAVRNGARWHDCIDYREGLPCGRVAAALWARMQWERRPMSWHGPARSPRTTACR